MPGWLSEWSEHAVREAVPQLAHLPVALVGGAQSDPAWASGRATFDGRAFAKFALSQQTAVRIRRETRVLEALGGAGFPVPRLIAAGDNPTFSCTELLSGAPLTYATVASGSPARFADELACFLARLHAQEIGGLPRQPEPGMHVTTGDLRRRFPALIEERQRATVSRWLDWIDDEVAVAGGIVLVHGDFHPYNQLWDLAAPRLVAVLDFESCGLGEPEFDFRVLPVFGPGVALLTMTVERYEALTGRQLSVRRIMALHLLNYLGDALWRTEAGIALPEPGETPADYVDETEARLTALGIRV